MTMNLKKILKRKHLKYYLIAFMVIAMASCFKINNFEQPASGNAGDTLTVKMDVTMDAANALMDMPSKLIVAVLMPKGWDAANNTTITYTGVDDDGVSYTGDLSVVPDDVAVGPNVPNSWPVDLKKYFGFGANVNPDMEWVAFWTDFVFPSTAGKTVYTGTIIIKTKIGTKNLKAQLGYYFGAKEVDASDGGNYDVRFATFEVKNGTGETLDYLKPNTTVEPAGSLDNDIVTISFDASVGDTSLRSADEVYLCATGYTSSDSVTICGSEEKAKMENLGNSQWRIDFWPRNYFELNNEQTLDSMNYSFMNKSGAINVIDVTKKSPFKFKFGCN